MKQVKVLLSLIMLLIMVSCSDQKNPVNSTEQVDKVNKGDRPVNAVRMNGGKLYQYALASLLNMPVVHEKVMVIAVRFKPETLTNCKFFSRNDAVFENSLSKDLGSGLSSVSYSWYNGSNSGANENGTLNSPNATSLSPNTNYVLFVHLICKRTYNGTPNNTLVGGEINVSGQIWQEGLSNQNSYEPIGPAGNVFNQQNGNLETENPFRFIDGTMVSFFKDFQGVVSDLRVFEQELTVGQKVDYFNGNADTYVAPVKAHFKFRGNLQDENQIYSLRYTGNGLTYTTW